MCGCIYVDAGDPADFTCTKDIIAMRRHVCVECNRTIEPGETYERTQGKWWGEFHTLKTCLDCRSARCVFFCEGWTYGQIWTDIAEHFMEVEDLDLCCLNQLTPTARARAISLLDDLSKE